MSGNGVRVWQVVTPFKGGFQEVRNVVRTRETLMGGARGSTSVVKFGACYGGTMQAIGLALQ